MYMSHNIPTKIPTHIIINHHYTTETYAMSFSTLTILTFLLLTSTSASAQSTNTPACVSNILPCANYFSTTSAPPESCCGPLKTALTTQIDCVCGLYNTPGLLQTLNINVTKALDLPKRCSIDGVTLAVCSKVGGSAPSPSESVAPPGNSGTPTPGKDENVAEKMTGFGISGLVFIMSWAGVLLLG